MSGKYAPTWGSVTLVKVALHPLKKTTIQFQFQQKNLFRNIGFCELALFDTDLGNHESAGKSYLQKTFDVNCQKLTVWLARDAI